MSERRENKLIYARDFGARGDGVTDDTAAVQAALDYAWELHTDVIFDYGVFMCHDLILHPYTGIKGLANWAFSTECGCVLKLNDENATCLLNITDAVGANIEGIVLHGNRNLGRNVHGIYKKGANIKAVHDSFDIVRCKALEFSGDGFHFEQIWCGSIRACMSANNGGSGILCNGCDLQVSNSICSGNKKSGFITDSWIAGVMLLGNHFEWNHLCGLDICCGNNININANLFDRNGTCGISLNKSNSPDVYAICISGNTFSRNGASNACTMTDNDCHIFIYRANGAGITSNVFLAGADDNGRIGRVSPSFGVVHDQLQDSVITGNTWFNGVTNRFLVCKSELNETNIIAQNTGRIK